MADNLDLLNTAVSLLIKAVLLAARFSGRVRRRSLSRLANRNVDAKAKEILFLKDRVCQLEMQVSILQKPLDKKGTKPRYEVRERLLLLWQMEAFQIPRRKVFQHFGMARSMLYHWLHKIEDQMPASTAANKSSSHSGQRDRTSDAARQSALAGPGTRFARPPPRRAIECCSYVPRDSQRTVRNHGLVPQQGAA